MFRDKLSLRVAWPSILLGLVLLVASTTAAMYLQREQARTAELLRENVSSRTVAQNLETNLESLIALLRRGSTQVDDLNEYTKSLLHEADAHADKQEEKRLVDELMASFDRYAQAWQDRQDRPSKQSPIESAVRTLESETLPRCRTLREYNGEQIVESEQVHGKTVKWMSWGLAGVGGVGALAGVMLGYGVARSLRRSIYQLSIRVRDAADRLGQDLPAVTLVKDGDLPQLRQQMEKVVRDIETVVQQLQQREREVLRAEQLGAVGQLAAGAAHELRNPLTAIKMLVQTNREEAAARGLPIEDLRVIEQEVRRMEQCLHTFLDFARLPKPEHRAFAVASVVDKTLALLEGRARQQQVSLHFAPTAKSIVVEADPEQIQQVLVNLTLNALDAMPHGGRLEVELVPPVNDQLKLRVCDTGPGIAPQLMPRLFEPFVSSKETGLGLGLVVSRRIAEAHGGELRASNRPEGGACFELRLPVHGAIPAGSTEI